jgi:chromate transporter
MIHDELISQHLADQSVFAESLAVGQISPGPNGLWVVCLGYFMGGWKYGLLAGIAIALPPLLVLLVARIYERHRSHPVVQGVVSGIEVGVIAILLVVMGQFLASSSPSVLSAVCFLAAFGLTLQKSVPSYAILLGAAVAGILWVR